MNEGFPAVLGNLWLGSEEAQARRIALAAEEALCLIALWRCCCAAGCFDAAPPLPPPLPLLRRGLCAAAPPAPPANVPRPARAPAAAQAVASALLPKLEKTRKEVEELLFEVVTLEVSQRCCC